MAVKSDDRETKRAAWREAHDRELAERAAAKRAEREERGIANRAANAVARARVSYDADQLALDELVAKQLGIPVDDVPAWRADRQRYMASLGTLEEQLAKAPVAGKEPMFTPGFLDKLDKDLHEH